MPTSLPTPANSSPPLCPRRVTPPPPRTQEPSPSPPRGDDSRAIAAFLRNRPNNPHSSLRVEYPSAHLLQQLRHLQSAALVGCTQQRQGENENHAREYPLSVAHPSILRRLRLRYIPAAQPPVLVFRPMPTPLHDCVQDFVYRYLVSERVWLLRRLLTRKEVGNLKVAFGTLACLPGGPAEKGFRDPLSLKSTSSNNGKRKKGRAIEKEPDVAVRYVPLKSVRPAADEDDDCTSDEDDDSEAHASPPPSSGKTDGPSTQLPIPVFPAIVMEVGYSERYEDLLADCADCLVSAGGHIKLAILIKISESEDETADSTLASSFSISTSTSSSAARAITTHTSATTASTSKPAISSYPPLSPPPSDSSTHAHLPPRTPSPPTANHETDTDTTASPDSTAEDYVAIAASVWGGADMDVPPPPALDAFLECWELAPVPTTNSDNSTNTATPQITLRHPRIPLITHGLPHKRIKVPLCRSDVGLPEPDDDSHRRMFKTDWSVLAELMMDAQKENFILRTVREGKVRRAGKRVREGDVGGDYVPEEEEEGGGRRTRAAPVWGGRMQGE